MRTLVLSLAAAALAVAASAFRADAASPLTDAEMISTNVGLVVGAATACDNVSPDRISRVVEKTTEAVAEVALDEDERASAQDLFQESALAGRAEVTSGNLDCDRVERAVAELDRGM